MPHTPDHKGGDKMDSDKKKKKGGKTEWMTHLDKVFKEGRKKNKDYKYSDAMKDAKKSYKKSK